MLKYNVLFLRSLCTSLWVFPGTEEFFVFIPPQHKSVYVVGGVLQPVLVQHACALGKAHTRQPIVLCHDNIPRLYPVDQRKVHAVSPFIEHQCLRTFTLDLVSGPVAAQNDFNYNEDSQFRPQTNRKVNTDVF